jgi:hypothetical protein
MTDPYSYVVDAEGEEHIIQFAPEEWWLSDMESLATGQPIAGALTGTAEDRYREFLETCPSVARRVPQWMLASYLGIAPETLSRLRAIRRPRA